MTSPLISTAHLQHRLSTGEALRVFDCTFDLQKPENGPAQFLQQHIAGALYADLNLDLSATGQQIQASGGRHPLPERADFAAWLGRQGVQADTPVVVYDRNNAVFAGRLWWMLRWCGHASVAVLDGGLQAWLALGAEVSAGPTRPPHAVTYSLSEPRLKLVSKTEVAAQLGFPNLTLIDARAQKRFTGAEDPLDPIAGHIPGALNRPFGFNIGADGLFKPATVLRQELSELLAGRDPSSVVHYCGSGVSAVGNLMAMEIAGLGTGGLYAGSWSDWSTTPGLPCAQG